LGMGIGPHRRLRPGECEDAASAATRGSAPHWYLQPEAALTTNIPPDSQASHFRYDPADPTPNVGGATNATLGRGTGAQDNRKLEARPDVLSFTGPTLENDLEIIGLVAA